MSSPLQVLSLTANPPDLITSGFGPFVVQPCASLDEVANQIHAQPRDVLLLDLALAGGVDRLANWTALPRVLLDVALVVLLPEPSWAECQRLLQLGVREVLGRREATGEALARVLRLAIERKRQDDTARRALSSDLTTGLPNHAQLLEHMTHLLALREREPAAMALVVLHLDGLRPVEVRQGIESANVLRRKVAVRLRAALRASDVVAALGGDVFAVLLSWMDSSEDGRRVAQKLAQTTQQPFQVAGQPVPVRVRVGLALYPEHGRDAQTLMRQATSDAACANIGQHVLGGNAANDES